MEEHQSRPFIKRLFLPISAIAGIILLCIVLLVNNQNSTSLPPWADAFAIPDPGFSGSLGQQTDSPLEKAMVQYKQGAYDEALRQFQQLSAEVIDSDTLNFLIAQCHFGRREWKKSQQILKQISPASKALAHKSQWYYALCELGINEREGVRLLQMIKEEEEHPFQEEAILLLESRM